jgi:hypothetical protein
VTRTQNRAPTLPEEWATMSEMFAYVASIQWRHKTVNTEWIARLHAVFKDKMDKLLNRNPEQKAL